MRPNIIVGALAVIALLIAGSIYRGAKRPDSRRIVIYLNDFGHVTRVEDHSGLPGLDVSGIKVTRR